MRAQVWAEADRGLVIVSTGTGQKYQTLLSISPRASTSIWRCPDRLCQTWGGTTAKTKHREGTTPGGGMCANTNKKLAEMRGRYKSRFQLVPRVNWLIAQFLEDDVDNEISLTAFRLLVMDLLVFFHVVNEGVINVLGTPPTIPVLYQYSWL